MKKWYLVNRTFPDQDDKKEIIHGTREDTKMISQGGDLQSCSPGYDTKEALIEGQGILPKPCKKCAGIVATHYNEPTKTQIKELNYCFSCLHFLGVKVAADIDPNRVIINGGSYHISPDTDGYFKGFGGREFSIVRFDNPKVVITSRNLWHQGTIPKVWREDIPDNARFAVFIDNDLKESI